MELLKIFNPSWVRPYGGPLKILTLVRSVHVMDFIRPLRGLCLIFNHHRVRPFCGLCQKILTPVGSVLMVDLSKF